MTVMQSELRDLIASYLRQHPDWREHPEEGWTYLRWEHLPTGDRLPTDLAGVRQLEQEGLEARRLTP